MRMPPAPLSLLLLGYQKNRWCVFLVHTIASPPNDPSQQHHFVLRLLCLLVWFSVLSTSGLTSTLTTSSMTGAARCCSSLSFSLGSIQALSHSTIGWSLWTNLSFPQNNILMLTRYTKYWCSVCILTDDLSHHFRRCLLLFQSCPWIILSGKLFTNPPPKLPRPLHHQHCRHVPPQNLHLGCGSF